MLLARALSAGIRRASQEQAWPFGLDWSHPEAEGLEELIIATPMGMIDLVSMAVGTRVGTEDPGVANEFGAVDSFFDGDGDQYTFPNNTAFDTTADFTIVWECQLSSFVDANPCISSFYSASGFAARLAYGSASGSDLLMADGVTLLARMARPTGVSMTDRHWGVWSFNPGSGHRVWINGGQCTDNGTTTPSNTANSRRVGGSGVATQDFNGAIRQIRRYNVSWSEERALAFYAPETSDSLLIGSAHSPFISGMRTAAGSGSSVASGSASLTASYVLTAVGVALAGGTASLTGSVSLSAAGASFSSGSAGATALVSISAAGLAEAAGQAGLSLGALLFAFGYAQASGNAHISVRDNHIYPDRVTTIRIRGDSNLFVRA